ncbi:hypothetical protein [Streptomyces sp. SID14478]|nr:hypothetical protein [Streptomyces sp. SID14478]
MRLTDPAVLTDVARYDVLRARLAAARNQRPGARPEDDSRLSD